MKIPIKPKLKSYLTYRIVEPDGVFLMSEQNQYVLQDDAYVRLMPLLDGNYTVGEILAQTKIYPQKLFSILNHLLQIGCLIENHQQPNVEYQCYWDYWNVLPEKVIEVQSLPLEIHALGNVNIEDWASTLQENGFVVTDKGIVNFVVVDDYLHPDLANLNQKFLKEKRTWFLVKPQGMIVWMGPMFRPGFTSCWECLAQKLRVNRQVEHFMETFSLSEKNVVRSKCQSTSDIGLNLAILEISKALLAPPRSGLENKILTLDLQNLEFKEHIVMQRPQCSICGNPNALEPKPLKLHSCKKVLPVEQYDHRCSTHENTFYKYEHLISPISGVITSFLPRTKDAYARSYNYLAGHYFPILSEDLTLLRVSLITRSGGHGHTEIEAKTSTLAEAIERYSGIFWGEEKTVVKSYDEIGEDAFFIRELSLFSDDQYKNREKLNQIYTSDQQYIPELLDTATPISWTPAWSLTSERFFYLPTAYCFYGFRDKDHFFSVCDSNGCAAGNSLEEAILQGLLEVVERDAISMWWYNRYQCPSVDVESFNLSYWKDMQQLYTEKLNRDLFVLDVTSDWGIPTFVAVSRRLNHKVEDIIVGFGSHLDPKRALLRSLEEANQYLPALSMQDKEGNTMYQLTRPETVDWWKKATYENQSYLLPNKTIKPKTWSDYKTIATNDIFQDLQYCLKKAKELNLEVLVVNQTRPDIHFPVVKVVIPGMRHFWRRLAPGRLYDIPVQQGHLPKQKTEQEMNPIACFV
ncbi:MAG: TOMM precursor leader peptide-binding protein [Planctomycetes bacterium]|nr:TOMM precursor leader peptide-binding protein [Planctomycetota bacterium]